MVGQIILFGVVRRRVEFPQFAPRLLHHALRAIRVASDVKATEADERRLAAVNVVQNAAPKK